MVRAFDDADVIHVEGDVNPIRDMEIISNELRLKDIEWVEKHLDSLKKTGRSLGNSSLADKAKKEEIVRVFLCPELPTINLVCQATVEKILKTLTVDKKDIRKGEWTNKEVRILIYQIIL